MSNVFGIMIGQIDRCMDKWTDGRNLVLFGTAFGEGEVIILVSRVSRKVHEYLCYVQVWHHGWADRQTN